ncbi:hypothetical protein C0J45_3578 [Silurus meridionalis]|nr:hypothetical protein C0J45_3578 [Silurus meridionalis]
MAIHIDKQSTIRIGLGNTPEVFKIIKQEDQELEEQLKIGDLILVPRHSQCVVSATGYYHAGVYLSGKEVGTEPINVFCQGNRYIVYGQEAGIPHDLFERVSAALRRNPKYDLLKYNCVHFVLELLRGEPEGSSYSAGGRGRPSGKGVRAGTLEVFKLFYHGVDGKRNGVGVILKEEYSKSVVEVKRVSDRVMIVKVEVEGMMINVISAYAPQVGCEMEEKERFWSELDDVVDGVPRKERLVIGADFNGHERNVEGQLVVDFAKRMEMAVVNTYFKKKEDHRVTYKSGGKCTQLDYVLCRRCNLKEIGDCKVLAGDSVARQHRMVVCRMVLEAKNRRRVRTERRIRWWKLKEEECSVRFREEVRQGLSGVEEVLDDWATTAGVMREAARKE